MKILYIGDIMAEAGIKTVEKLLPGLRSELGVDVAIAQAENVTDGKGISKVDYVRLQKAGVDAFTGGNWSLYNDEIHAHLSDPQQPIVRPANYPEGTLGQRYKVVKTPKGVVLIISLLGAIVGRDADKPTDNPLQVIDEILDETKDHAKVATVVNFHGDFSSEKIIIGYYLDGQVSLVIGDHWHVPTADAMILPKGTAHQTDVGMCGALHASLGISLDSVIPRWHDNIKTRNELETSGPFQFNALLVDVNEETGLASSVEPIQRFIG
ncbi:MAG: TIGR00282 family metallophosphoesterase [Candidatus Saccharibacteria bacterium]